MLEIESQPAVIESALNQILDEEKSFIAVYDQAGQPTGDPGEYTVEIPITEGLLDDAIFVVTAVARDALGEESSERMSN